MMTNSQSMLFLMAALAFLLVLLGCSVPLSDTNGYYSRMPREHQSYCQVTKGKVVYFVPCNSIKHDEEI